MARRGASLEDRHFVACQAMAVGIVLRELAEAIDMEWSEDNAC
jgi:hypothetical protein